eukprot:Skav224753  [mRNA]  locus=scaffold580:318682:324604:- [translate_table: standard]
MNLECKRLSDFGIPQDSQLTEVWRTSNDAGRLSLSMVASRCSLQWDILRQRSQANSLGISRHLPGNLQSASRGMGSYMAFCEVSQDQSPGTPAAAGDFGFKVLTSSDPAEKTVPKLRTEDLR